MQIITTLGILFSINLIAADLENFDRDLFGKYQVTSGYVSQSDDNRYTYLKCDMDREVDIEFENDQFSISGLTEYSPLKFEAINEKPIGVPGPLLGFSQRRSILIEISEGEFVLKNQHRQCEALIGKIGCIGKKWRTSLEAHVFHKPLGKSQLIYAIEVTYKPFASTPTEKCLIGKLQPEK